jgi:hypothetical protein
MQGPTSKKTNEPPKRLNQKGSVKFPNPPPVARNISNKKRGVPPERRQGKTRIMKTQIFHNSKI